MSTPSAELQTTELQVLERERVYDQFRRWGYLEANLNPLGGPTQGVCPELRGKSAHAGAARRAYCGSVGVEFMHIPHRDRREWIQERMENPAAVAVDREWLAERLLQADLFEQILQTRYVGTKRYSGEGLTAIIPMLDEALETGADLGAGACMVAMSHRGRLTVLTLTIGIPPENIFARFEDVDPRSFIGGGDVKYHHGATGEYRTRSGKTLRMHLASNPSHLEAIDPVVLGRTRAKQMRIGKDGAREVMSIVLHGDAAFAGQGIWAETLNYSGLKGFSVGGTLHIIGNNQVGFTTNPAELHTAQFASDLAKRQQIPIFHVNAEDAEAVLRTARMAVEYRYQFGADVVVDVIGYRRHGHSEVDDPTITQPLLYKKINAHPPLYQIYAEKHGIDISAMEARYRAAVDAGYELAGKMQKSPSLRKLPAYWS